MARKSSSRLKNTVMKVLTTAEIRWVNIEYVINRALTLNINSLSYFAVAAAIAKDRIDCVVDSSLDVTQAFYDASSDELTASNKDYGSENSTDYRLERALLVHEATHAVLDMYKGQSLPVIDEETIGYLAQAIYSRATKAPAVGGPLGAARRLITEKSKGVTGPELNSGCYRFRFNAKDAELRELKGEVRAKYSGAVGSYVANGIKGGLQGLLE